MKIVLDTNVVLDLLMRRDPFYEDALKIFTSIESKRYEAYLCATAITTIHYLLSKHSSNQQAKKSIRQLLQLFEISSVTKEVLLAANEIGFKDYEDGVLYASAKFINADAIITRNEKDFKKSEIAIYSPVAFIGV